MFTQVAELNELLKSYHIATRYDERRALQLRSRIDELRIDIAFNAEGRKVYVDELDVDANSSGYAKAYWYSKNDTEYTIIRIIAFLSDNALISAVNQGDKQRIITRNPTNWQQLFSGVQLAAPNGQQIPFDFPVEEKFGENEALGLSVINQSAAGNLFFHGSALNDNIEDVRRSEITNEITQTLPQFQVVPLEFSFPNNAVGTLAVNAAGGNDILSSKYDRSIILTGVSTSAVNCKLTLIDTGRNQYICDNVEMLGVAGTFDNKYQTYYPLPYPHLLKRADRLKIRVENGSDITSTTDAADTPFFLTFHGFTM